jgi:hypothetical protein
MKYLKFLLPFLLLSACTQEPLFYYIALEYPPIAPIIEGAPSPIVEFKGKLYVSNNDIWICDITNPLPSDRYQWERITTGPGRVKTLAVTSGSPEKLYALGWNGEIWESDDGSFFTHLVTDSYFQQIYGAEDALFIGKANETYYLDEYLNDYLNGLPTKPLDNVTGLLMGAVWDGSTNYYLGTLGGGMYPSGIFSSTSPSGSFTSVKNANIKGMIKLRNNDVVAVGTTGVIYHGSNFNDVIYGPGFSGALALWKDGNNNEMLLLGLEQRTGGSIYAYGYRELKLDSNGGIGGDSGIYLPGNDSGGRATSIDPNMRNNAAIGKYPVNSIYAANGSDSLDGANPKRPIIFASTQQNGLWSYRYRSNGGIQWNGEDNNP